MANFGFLIDASRCIDCRACLIACSIQNEMPPANTRIWIKDTGVLGSYPEFQRYTAPYHCMQCLDPACVSACTVGALHLNEDGVILYDDDRCIGCRYCMYACPFEVPHFEWSQRFSLVTKCDLCSSRLAQGQKETACAATCPTGAIQFGRREDMLAAAHDRIQSEAGKYIDHVFGETENGGTSTFYISPVSFEQLGMPVTQRISSPARSNRIVMEEGTPIIAGTAAVGLTAAYLALEYMGGKRSATKAETAATEDRREE